MSGAYMSVERDAVVKGFSTRTTSKRTFNSLLVVRFQVTIENRLVSELLFAGRALIRFHPSMGSYMSFKIS